jgi:hypothetical protein
VKSAISILACLYLFQVCVCTGDIAGTETTNGDEVTVTATTDYIAGSAPNGFEIRLFADDFYPFNDSGFSRSVTVSDSGTFQFLNLQSGNYNIYCKSSAGDTSVFIQQIVVQATDHSNTDTVALATVGIIEGKLVDTLSKPVRGGYAYIKGSPFFATTNDSGEYQLTTIPQGRYNLEFFVKNRSPNGIKGPPVSVSVDVSAGKTTVTEPVIYKQ